MPITVKMYDTTTLLGVQSEMPPVITYWLDLCFPNIVQSEDEAIDFEKVFENRRVAPYVVPTEKGRPLYAEKSKVQRFKPAYIKLLDPVTPGRMLVRRPGELARAPLSPEQRGNAIIADIMRVHRNAAERRWELMAAQAIIDGAVTIEGPEYPKVIVDFERAANHTVDLTDTGSVTWDATDGDPLGSLNTMITRVRRARFGGVVNRVTFGGDAWEVFRKDPEVVKQLDTTRRGSNANFNSSGLRSGEDVEYVGSIGALDLYVYSGYYENAAGDAVDILNSKKIVLTGPNVQGVRAYGAIQDKAARLQALPLFPKMYEEDNPSVTYCLTQSAPLMVPMNPNATLSALVVS